MGKSECSYALSEMSYFSDVERPGQFAAPDRILRDTDIELYKTHKIGTVHGKPEGVGSVSMKQSGQHYRSLNIWIDTRSRFAQRTHGNQSRL